MANEYLVNSDDLTAVADAIRNKGGTSEVLEFPSGFVSAVGSIEAGVCGYTIDDIANNNIIGDITITATEVKEGAFYNKTGITGVYLPNISNFSNIGKMAFQYCTGLKFIEAKNASSSWMNTSVFNGCKSLEDIELNVYGFADSTFVNCTSLRRVVLPYARYFNNYVFNGCSSLEYFDIGRYETGDSGYMWQIFAGCLNLKTIIIRNPYVVTCEASTFNSTPFASNGTGGMLYVPEALISGYQNATNWSAILAYENNQILPIEGSEYE